MNDDAIISSAVKSNLILTVMEKPSWALIITSVISSNFQVVNTTTDTVVACVVDNEGATRFNEISSTIVKCLISEKVSRIFDNHRNRAYICCQHFVEWWLSAEMGLIYFVPHQEDDIDTLSVILAICEGNAPVIGGFPRTEPVMQNFVVLFDVDLNKMLDKIHIAGDFRRLDAYVTWWL